MPRLAWLVALAAAPAIGSGCGLTWDVGPPDLDAGTSDGGRVEASIMDARGDAGGRDAGACRLHADCDDGDVCNGAELCNTGRCVAGPPLECDDGDFCNGAGSCDATTGCTHGTPPVCDDGDPCNGIEECFSAGCAPGTPIDCDDHVACTVDRCLDDGSCANEADDGLCTAGSGGVCDPVTDCQYDACGDGTCVARDLCETAECSGGMCWRTRLPCPTGHACCAGACVSARCDDGNPCTDDSCDMSTGCVHAFNTNPCDDGDPCSVGDRCAMGRCVALGRRLCDDLNPCTDDSCSPATGTCGSVPNARPCEDGSRCTTGDLCVGGVCVSGPLRDCDDGNPCTIDACSPLTGDCVYVGRAVCCGPDMEDCDGDGECECDLRSRVCDPRTDGCIRRCTNATDCPRILEDCCAFTGRCYDSRCLSCCMYIGP